jgi:hypothetical protein
MSAEVLAAIELPAPYADLAGQVAPEARDALADALATGADAELALLRAGISAEVLLQALAARHGLEATAYDERLSVPPELVAEIDRDMLATAAGSPWALRRRGPWSSPRTTPPTN